MVSSLLNVDFDDMTEAIPAFIAAVAMPFMYSISEGISMGVISYVAINLLSGEYKNQKSQLDCICAGSNLYPEIYLRVKGLR